MSEQTITPIHDHLIRGHDYLAQRPEFALIGRLETIQQLTAILTRRHANNILLVGSGGVGCSALCLGLEERKSAQDAPYDLISKRFFWLDSDGLFTSGNPNTINDSFQKTLKTLARTPDSVLIIDDMRDFIEASRSNGASNLINALMRAVRKKDTQVIIESRDADLNVVLSAHSDMREYYTVLDLGEPAADELTEIVAQTARRRLEPFHKIRIADSAIAAALELTEKYRVRDMGLNRAQPERSLTLLDRALTSYRLRAHSKDPRIVTLEAELETLAQEDPSAARINELKANIQAISQSWQTRQHTIKKLFQELRSGEEGIRRLENELETQLIKEADDRQNAGADQEATNSTSAVNRFMLDTVNLDSDIITRIKQKMAQYEALVKEKKDEFEAQTKEINDQLELKQEQVLIEFSSISRIPVTKLTQDERKKLLHLDAQLAKRVYGQEVAVTKLANQVRVAKAGLQAPNKPQAAFLFLGPSGVGKTEIAKALTAELFDDENALLRFDMSEYMEKHAVAKLIGAPPGYEGYEAGGILTNELRKNPRRIILFDEIEKAHPDVFNVFLQILDDARLTDNRGLTVSFRDTIILMTTNIGTQHFLGESNFAVAEDLALADLEDVYRPEFLNRFNGRQNIVCFKTLGLSIIEMIATREISKLNEMVQATMPNLTIAMDTKALSAMCRDHYKPVNGARGITGYIEGVIKPEIANTVLFADQSSGTITIGYDEAERCAVMSLPDGQRVE
ncbi:AAA family ATPase [Halopseudomonas laoshanensis]|uniref:AAA family ATPase n=1 Tax=Halopseudomonas laoshanensis TaxID=2268758 RepID=A0A7V7GN93_9GAMM|nr:AAA family ATPase [Halopseudomonas laoshanensis]KAA0690867.1 AAA family ATPase [Halopseudomonas laoshanensis]